jgi:outer membrane receptor protein involved in Fe transport
MPPTTRASDSESSVTPRLGITYQGEKAGLFYATIAKGYRDGGVYPPFWGCGYGPVPYPPDTLWSYEIGSKSSLFERRVDLDTSIFHINWGNDVQPFGADCAFNNYRPLSSAVSNGVNVALRAYPNERARIGVALAYIDAHYTETVKSDGAIVIKKGDVLGNPPRVPSPWSITASIEHDFTMVPGVRLTVRAEDVYHSQNPGPFYTQHPASSYYSPDRRPNPATNLLNLRATVAWSRFDTALFVSNALDSRPTLTVSNACCTDPLLTGMTFRPRTVGASVTWRY